MWSLFRILMDLSLLKPIVRPITRLLVGFIAVPIFRAFTKKVLRVQQLDLELEKDLEQWFRGALLLLVATQNMEAMLFPWVKPLLEARRAQSVETRPQVEDAHSRLIINHDDETGWILLGLRVMLAIGVVQMMPDQELFAVIHHGPPKLKWEKGLKFWFQVRLQAWPYLRGHLCTHLNRSSPVFAILAAIYPGTPGWICYGMALGQYLIIGLVTSRDKALDVIHIFDQTVQRRREELIEEYALRAPTLVPLSLTAPDKPTEPTEPTASAEPSNATTPDK